MVMTFLRIGIGSKWQIEGMNLSRNFLNDVTLKVSNAMRSTLKALTSFKPFYYASHHIKAHHSRNPQQYFILVNNNGRSYCRTYLCDTHFSLDKF